MADPKYTLSTNIQIFPTSSRPIYDPVGRLTTEYNLTSILNRLLDMNGFVITKCNKGTNLVLNTPEDKIFEFNLHGYLIHIEDITDITNQFNGAIARGTKIYACINVQEVKGSSDSGTATLKYDHQRVDFIKGDDNNIKENSSENVYNGVFFTLDTPSDSDYHTHKLAILEKTLDGWTIPEDSKIKFETNTDGSCRSVKIDDGIL